METIGIAPQKNALDRRFDAKIRRSAVVGPPEFFSLNLVPQQALTAKDRVAQLEAESLGPEPWYRREAAEILAEIAAWSYADAETLADELEHRGILSPGAECHEVSLRNEPMLVVATAFVIRSGNVVIVSFRGTEPRNAINFLTDATVEPRAFRSMGSVHGGFYRNLRAVWTDVAHWIQEAEQNGTLKALYLTGHSLGGAMAVLAAATIFGDERFARWRPLVKGVYTFGGPMAGDAAFAQSCDERFGKILFRHVYGKDLVPRMPPLSTGRFRHSGKEYAGSRQGWTPRAKPVEQAVTAFLSLPLGLVAWTFKQFPWLRWVPMPFSIDDHSPNTYLEAFRAARD